MYEGISRPSGNGQLPL